VAQLGVASARRGNLDRVVTHVAELVALDDGQTLDGEAREAFVESGARVANHLILGGRRDLGGALLSQIRRVASLGTPGPAALATLLGARAADALYAGEPERCHQLSLAAAECYLSAGSLRLACVHKANAAYACIEAGALAVAEEVLRELLPLALRLGAPSIVASTRQTRGHVLAQRGALDEAVALEREAIGLLRAQGDRRLEGAAETTLAVALGDKGQLEAAAAAAERGVSLLEVAPPLRAAALATLALIRLRQERAPEARALAEQAVALLEALGSLEEGESLVRLADVLTLDADGKPDQARARLTEARARLLERADKIRGDWRERFLAVRDNARTLELADAWRIPP
jgi:tetratricopeptide (TPR) repeat protein